MAKACTLATNFLNFCMTCSDGLDLWLETGVACVDFSACVGSIYTGSVLFWGWAVALGSKYMGIG